ncbi:MAG TPA: MBL fold metallo-hydrolase [Woeseiaceae bacterium]|nr:MBL fold metallo-hydrolase [Woeseiaceae bacterium]
MKRTEGPQVAPGKSTGALASLVAAAAAITLVACSPPSDTPETPDTPQTPREPASQAAAEQTTTANDVYRFTIGDFDAVALRDGGLEVPNDGKVFAIDRSPEDVAALLTAAGLPSDHLSLSIQPLLVRTADRVLLFDTGAGANFGGAGGKLPASMAAAGIDPADVTDIFISHTHGDHIGGLVSADGALAFPNATIHISSPEWEFFEGMPAETGSAAGDTQHAALIAAITPKIAEFAPGADILPGVVKAVEIRGHTPGHSGYLISSGQESLLYIGDAMHHPVVSVQRPDWTIAFDSDAPTAEASRKALLARSADSGQRIYAVHFPFPGLGKIARVDGGFEWVPE